MKKIRLGALVLAMLLAGSSFASCNKNGDTDTKGGDINNPDDTNTVDDKTGEDGNKETDSSTFDLPDDVRFDGETFSLYIAHSSRKGDYIREEETGDLINDAIYARNEATKDRLGIDLNFVCSTLTTSGC